ncbi:MAG: hypothetical protein ABMA64_15520, partial [Myxococcota bacterium]
MVGGLIALGCALVARAAQPLEWTEAELELLERAPPELDAPAIVWVKGPAAPLDEVPRLVVEVSGDRLVVGAGGLDERIAAWASAHPAPPDLATALLERAVIEALAARADQARGLSRSRGWRALSDWSGGRPGERDPLAFADRRGRRSPRADFATVVGAAWGPALPGDPPLAAACRMPSKVAWAERALGPAPNPPACVRLADTPLSPARVSHLDLVYVSASVRHPASTRTATWPAIDAQG